MASPPLAQAEEEPELRMAQCDLQCVIQRPEESKATQQQQELEENAQDREKKLPRILQHWPARWYQRYMILLILVSDHMLHLSQNLDYNETSKHIK